MPVNGTTALPKVGVRKSTAVCQDHRMDLLRPFLKAWPYCRVFPPRAFTVTTLSLVTPHPGPIHSHPDICYGIVTSHHMFTFIPKLTCHSVLSVPTINSFQLLVSLLFFPKVVFSENRRRLHKGTSTASSP